MLSLRAVAFVVALDAAQSVGVRGGVARGRLLALEPPVPPLAVVARFGPDRVTTPSGVSPVTDPSRGESVSVGARREEDETSTVVVVASTTTAVAAAAASSDA